MKKINNYILEKLRINKDSKLDNIDNAALYIADICNISSIFPENENINKEIKNWCEENKITDFFKQVECYVPLTSLKKRNSGLKKKKKNLNYLNKIKDVPSFGEINLDLINKLIEDAELIAENTKNDRYGKLYVYKEDYRYKNSLIYVLDYCETYFWFKIK